MDKPNQDIDDLLSSKLDGTLSADNSVELEDAMAKDPALSRVLDDLRAAQRLLVAGRPKLSLGSDFAASVTKAAQKRVAETGEKAVNWIPPQNQLESVRGCLPIAAETKRSVRWLSAGVLSLAATLLLVWLTLPSLKQDELAVVPSPAEANVRETKTGEQNAEPDRVSDERREPINASSSIALPVSQPSDSSRVPTVSDAPILNSTNHPLVVAQADARSLNAGEQTFKLDVTVATRDPAKTEAMPKLFYTMVLDVSIDPKAVENRSLERILEKYNIVYTDDLVIDDSQLQSLMDSKLVGTGDTEEKMGVMFLRSTAKKLDLAIREIINQFEEFPDFALDVTTDPSAQLLVKQLGSIQVAEGSDGLAHRLAVGKAGRNSSPFSASTRRGRPMPTNSRTTYQGGIVSASSADGEMSNVLFLIRPVRK